MMKRIFVKSIVLLLVVLLAAFAFAACQNEISDPSESSSNTPEGSGTNPPNSDSGSESGTGSANVPDDGKLHIFENGAPNYSIVGHDGADSAEATVVTNLYSGLADITGYRRIVVGNDFLKKGQSYDLNSYEILVGKTDYPQSKEVLNDTEYGEYNIKVVGNKLVVAAWDPTALQAGVDYLISVLRNAAQEGTLVVDADLVVSRKVIDQTLNAVPVVENSDISHVYDANGATELIYKNADPKHFNDYVAKLTAEGYTHYASNERGGVLSAIFHDDKSIFNIFYEDHYRELCVVVEKFDAAMLPPKDSNYQKICDTAFVQLGTEYAYASSDRQNGMCYIWRLENGEFVILDGGFNTGVHADNLYKVLQKLAPNPNKITIACWIISHYHGDHVGTFVSFSKAYGHNVILKSMLYNLPTLEESQKSDMNWNYWYQIRDTYVPIYRRNNPDLVLYRAHPGQIYNFANFDFEVIYTIEMYAPADLSYYNTCSLVVDAKFGEFNMLMLGDMSEPSNKIIRDNYGDSLKSEVVQVAHHGYQGGNTAFYTLVNPIYVIWPAGSIQLDKCHDGGGADDERNEYFYKSGTDILQIFGAQDYVCYFDLAKDTGFTAFMRYADIQAYMNNDPDEVQLVVKKK